MAAVLNLPKELQLGSISVGSKGQRSAPCKESFKVFLAEPKKEHALRTPFGKPSSFQGDSSRANLNVSADPQGPLKEWAEKLDRLVQEAARNAGHAQITYCGCLKFSKNEEYWPTVVTKVNISGNNCVKCWDEKGQPLNLDNIDFRSARVVPLCELKGIWIQGHSYGPQLECKNLLVYEEDASCPFF